MHNQSQNRSNNFKNTLHERLKQIAKNKSPKHIQLLRTCLLSNPNQIRYYADGKRISASMYRMYGRVAVVLNCFHTKTDATHRRYFKTAVL